MLHALDDKGKFNWVSKVRMKLHELGFGFVWLNQGVGDVSHFIRTLRERLIDCRWQEWTTHIQDSSRFNFYKQFSLMHNVPTYLAMNMNRQLKHSMTCFRFGISDLFKHYFWSRRHNATDLICPLCKTEEENEVHFVLCCPVLDNLRSQFIPGKYYRNPSQFKLCLLIASRNETTVKQFALFLYKAFKLRSTVCN